jgi:nucleoside-diphosphate-sugar epimerase
MRVLIFGDRGWIGGMVCKYLEKENIEFVKASCRANDKKLVEEELLKVEPTHVMSFIGRTHGVIGEKEYTTIDYLEQKGKILENVRDNLFSPVVLSLLCKKHNIHFSYLGTGCIFEFDEEHPFGEEINGFNEQSLPNFFGSSYSTVKGYTDELMHLFEESTLNLRIRMPITDEVNKRNFITKITTYEKVCSVPNSMTVLDELIPILVDMACNKVTGTVNLTNPGLISHNEMLEMYKEIVDSDFTWNNFSLEEQAEILAGGRSNNFLDTSKLESLYPEVRNIKDAVRETMKRMKEKIDCKCTSCDC